MRGRHFGFMVAMLLASTELVGAQVAQEPTIDLPSDARGAITIADISANGRVAFIGASRKWNGFGSTLSLTNESLSDDDGDGEVRFTPHGGVESQSLWLAVDTETGGVRVEHPGAANVRAFDLASGALLDGPLGETSRIRLVARQANVLLVRPGVGAWRRMLGDHSRYDEDATADGAFTLALDQMVPFVGSELPPDSLLDDDVLVILDAHRLAYAVTTASSSAWTREVK